MKYCNKKAIENTPRKIQVHGTNKKYNKRHTCDLIPSLQPMLLTYPSVKIVTRKNYANNIYCIHNDDH